MPTKSNPDTGENATLAEVAERLDLVANLLAANLVKGLPSDEQARQLSACGLSNADIARLLGKDSHAISQALYRARKSK